MLFMDRFVSAVRKERKVRVARRDVIAEQVRKVLESTDQKLILMVRS